MKNIFVWGLLYYLRFFARLTLFLHKPKVIGITGSVGKSSTRNALHAMMKDYFKVKVIKEGNSETGIPLGVLGLNPGNYRLPDWLKAMFLAPFKLNSLKDIQYLIIEMGIDSPHPPKNMDYLLTIVKPDIAVVLNVYPVHTMQFDEIVDENLIGEKRIKTILEKIVEEKMKIITKAEPKVSIYNVDDKNIRRYTSSEQNESRSSRQARTLNFGESEEADIKFLNYQVNLKRTSFRYLLKKENKEIEINIQNFVLPKRYLEVFAATIAVGKSIGLTNKKIVDGLSKNFTIPTGRGSIFEGINSSIIVDSSYNASKASVLTFLEMTKELSEKENRPFILLLGDMRELGQETKMEHEAVAKKIADLKVDQVYCVGPNTKKYVIPKIKKDPSTRTSSSLGMTGGARWFRTAVEAGDYLRKTLPYRAIVLVKGSQNEIFLEEAVKKILKNKSDSKKLCRQNDFWVKKKRAFFQGV
ncbi:hypothetical protein COY13_01765 [Candidatus Roizmanbacteria bacterium CG_4_10_14_0_2_um_filter_36_35]|uniref:Uncharacterized protein n=4 Tax=Candidatus Roizmaniibacteriota TaxID=1752723 RepID=A0A2M7BY33_9BACT|nr:MAG: hypothetical protein COV86_04565 [Candidatus Roizmanbacteria bacterium CG11_big_fil_rev_8_21_14_0_20_35_14]PIV11455.1 MAG: hypothetical protein COS50_00120 [Candidatus Roizmanbacteria bacterium CG03_land_8_20_14_0_80_35_26]PIZ68137.1 MAG: hypothetical protein COY13_01765 [Candidatus Roizmanbacteria bacterium CG_4_10_14_0_2_um_filter_36_35]PJC33684.1 MAG: hypothetical protein CO049_00080 [Candidatus Roizmanbacteria bacterium CG_4_9_14_0_2_um_filter_36_12]PJC79915.1 MAG: hypothetical prot